MGKCTVVIEGLEVNGTTEMASCFYLFCGTGVKCVQTGMFWSSERRINLSKSNINDGKITLITGSIFQWISPSCSSASMSGTMPSLAWDAAVNNCPACWSKPKTGQWPLACTLSMGFWPNHKPSCRHWPPRPLKFQSGLVRCLRVWVWQQ